MSFASIAAWGKGRKKSTETVSEQNPGNEGMLSVLVAPETESRDEKTLVEASAKETPSGKVEKTVSQKDKTVSSALVSPEEETVRSALVSLEEETVPPAAFSPEDEAKIAKLRQISQMWQFHPIPAGVEASQERRADAVQCGNVRVMGASVRGKKHIHGGSDCDDWFEIRAEQKNGVVFIAVSDGAGSKKFSRIGAKVSCQAAVESLQESFRYLSEKYPERLRGLCPLGGTELDSDTQFLLREIVSTAMGKARDSLYYALEKRISDPAYEDLKAFRDLSATLLLALVIPSESGEHTVSVCQVGDGAIVLFDSGSPYERAMSLLGTPDSGDYAGETEFMTSPSLTKQEFEKRTITRRLRFDSMFVMTDGVADDYFPAKPELFRLYCDLTANGVLPPKRADPPGEVIPVPAPLAFLNVETGKEAVPLNYAWLIQSVTKRSLQDLWNDAAPLERAFRLLPASDGAEEPEKRLAYWLEHYVEAASFDDRTLVVVRIGEGGNDHAAQET